MLSKVMYADQQPKLKTQTTYYLRLNFTKINECESYLTCHFGFIRVVY